MNDVLVTGAAGLVGSAVARKLESAGVQRIYAPPRSELDLLDECAVNRYFRKNNIQYVVHCAAAVGGISVNDATKYDKLYVNSKINSNVIGAFKRKCDSGKCSGKFLFMGSMCAYPCGILENIREDQLMSGRIERQNEGYALAKILGVKMCQYLNENKKYEGKFVSCMPANVYGLNDSFDDRKSHLIPSTIKKIQVAMKDGVDFIRVFGSGSQVRSFVYSDDLADAVYLILNKYKCSSPINVGPGVGVSVREIVEKISRIMNFNGKLIFGDDTYCGSPHRVENSEKIFKLGWKLKTGIDDGLKAVITDYLKKGCD